MLGSESCAGNSNLLSQQPSFLHSSFSATAWVTLLRTASTMPDVKITECAPLSSHARRHRSSSATCISARRMTRPRWLSRTSAASPAQPTWRSRGASSRTACPSLTQHRPAMRAQTAGRRCSLRLWHPRSVAHVTTQGSVHLNAVQWIAACLQFYSCPHT